LSDSAIRIRDLSKRYRLGSSSAGTTFREALVGAFSSLWHRPSVRGTEEDLWALRGVSLDVRHGDVVGIIGHNGAGKSTLLKILSRITEPSAGHAEIEGRIGSLLEVGTGFHSELTGRENIYLNGALLGMSRAQVRRVFDQIVAFSEVERFLDTPVKRYSSGMYMRLAFAVAAHLDTEVLLVDEVLAVGDVAFQRKCLAHMGNIAMGGRTILFVSHNMSAINALCRRCILLKQGEVEMDGAASDVTARYETELLSGSGGPSDLRHSNRRGSGQARFEAIDLSYQSADGGAADALFPGASLHVTLTIGAHAKLPPSNVAVILYDLNGYRLVDVNTALRGTYLSLEEGQRAKVHFCLSDVLLKPGSYRIGLWLGVGRVEEIDSVDAAATLNVVPSPGPTATTEVFPGPYQCRFQASLEPA